jgi:predicted small secreted protein
MEIETKLTEENTPIKFGTWIMANPRWYSDELDDSKPVMVSGVTMVEEDGKTIYSIELSQDGKKGRLIAWPSQVRELNIVSEPREI